MENELFQFLIMQLAEFIVGLGVTTVESDVCHFRLLCILHVVKFVVQGTLALELMWTAFVFAIALSFTKLNFDLNFQFLSRMLNLKVSVNVNRVNAKFLWKRIPSSVKQVRMCIL